MSAHNLDDIKGISLLALQTTEEAYLLLHGVTGTPLEMRGLAHYLHHSRSRIEVPLIAGHGGTLEDLRKVTLEAWLQSASLALQSLHNATAQSVHVVGLSFGALLAFALGEKYPNLIRSITALSPPLRLRSNTWDLTLSLLSRLPESAISPLSWAKQKKRRPPEALAVPHHTLPAYPLATAARVIRLRRHVLSRLPMLCCPLLVCFDPHDHLIDPQGLSILRTKLPRTQLQIREFPGGQHELTLGHSQQSVFETVQAFCHAVRPFS